MEKLKKIGIALGVLIVVLAAILLVIRSVNQSIVKVKGEDIVKNGGISEIVELKVNDTKQFLLIEGKDKNKPVLLILHMEVLASLFHLV